MSNVTKTQNRIDELAQDLDKLAVKYSDINYELCATYVSPGVKVDGGGFIIVGGHLHRVPGWNPTELAKAEVAVTSAAFTITSLMPAGQEREQTERSLLKTVSIEAGKSHATAT